MATVSMRELLEAGVHFGHQTRRWNPKMKKFIFQSRDGIYILDLHKTVECLERACEFVKERCSEGAKILFVGTKKQAQEVVREAAEETGMFYVNRRWIGGLLTNFQTVRKSVEKMLEMERLVESGEVERMPKKEAARLMDRLEKMRRYYDGVRDMTELPDIVYIVDTRREENAVLEARRLSIPIVAIVDTNCDPEMVDYPIPGNDDAVRSIRLITSKIVEAALEGIRLYEKRKAEEEMRAEKEEAEREEEGRPEEEEAAPSPAPAEARRSALPSAREVDFIEVEEELEDEE